MKSRIAVVGSLNLDLVTRVENLPAPGETVTGGEFATFHGGKGANQAFAAARLGGRVEMIGQVGADAYGDGLIENLAAAGVGVSGVGRDTGVPSGMAFISTDARGQNQIVIVPGANGTFGEERLGRTRAQISEAGVLLLQLEVPLQTTLAAARMAKEAGALVILDPAPVEALPDELLSLADYLTPNETELIGLAGGGGEAFEANLESVRAMARMIVGRGARNVLVKLGERGALLIREDGSEHFWEAVRVVAVDTTAAGDCFNAAFAVGLAERMTEEAAGRFASAAAACCVTRRGAQASMPDRREVEELLGG